MKRRYKWMLLVLSVFCMMTFSASVWAEEQDAIYLDLEDGEYAVDLELVGGSGKAFINTPTLLIIREGHAYAKVVWSSSNYDYMLVNGKKYLNLAEEEANSTFEIPITAMDTPMDIVGDTLAMGTPHEVEYKLTFFSNSIDSKSKLPQQAAKRVFLIAMIIIVGGGILNAIVKKKFRE